MYNNKRNKYVDIIYQFWIKDASTKIAKIDNIVTKF